MDRLEGYNDGMVARRYGKLKLYEPRDQKNIDELAEIFSMLKIVPMRAEYMMWNLSLEIDCYCKEFRELDAGERIPEYVLTIKKGEDGSIEDVYVTEYDERRVLNG